MRILVHDFGGYAFIHELSHTLAAQGHEIYHVYCASHQTTPLGIGNTDAGILTVRALHLKQPLNKYAWIKRWRQEHEYGRLAASALREIQPDILLSANAPLSAQHRLFQACRSLDIPFVFWLQDLIGVATLRLLSRRLGSVGFVAGHYFLTVERRLLRRSNAIIAISDDFGRRVAAMGIAEHRIHVVENWAPLKPATTADPTPLADELAAKPCFLYTGTLSMKHNPDLLAHLAATVQGKARVIVISQGMGAQWLQKEQQKYDLSDLTVLPYQPLGHLPSLYRSATVLTAVLNDDAGAFSIPSKVLTYLAAGKPLLLAVPADNLVARIVSGAGAGLVVDPNDAVAFGKAGLELLDNPLRCAAMSQAARTYAENAFNINRIAARFVEIIWKVLQ